MRLILVRHGEAHAGFVGPIAGPRGCAGLTDLGRRQARALRDHLAETKRVRADVLLASVLPRAIETAETIAPGLGLDVSGHDCDLCEVHTGEVDGMDWSEYNERFGSFDMEVEPDRRFAVGGDSWNSFHERVRGALDRLARDHVDETVVAVCHAGVIMASMRLLLGIADPATSAHLRPTNTGLTEWEFEPGLDGWILRSYNETDHLIGLAHAEHPDDEPIVLPRTLGTEGRGTGVTDFSTDSARAAAARDELGGWVAEFLASPGSDNAALGATLSQSHWWVGPVELPIDRLRRLAGPAGAPVMEVVEESEWRDDVDELADKVEDGHQPPPVVVTYRDDHLYLEDGNHRLEAIRRAGHDRAWAVVGFEVEVEDDVEPFDEVVHIADGR